MGVFTGKTQSMKMLIDFTLERGPFFEDSERVLGLAEEKVFDEYLSAAFISDIFYIVRSRLKTQFWV